MIYISILLFIASISVLFFTSRSTKIDDGDKRDISYVCLGGIGISSLIAILCSCTIIDPGYRGVQVTFGNINPVPLPEGWHMVNPFSSVKEMDVRVVAYEGIPHNAETADTQTVSVAITTIWRPDPSEVANLYQKYGLEYADKIITPAVKECTKAEIAKYKITELVTERPTISLNVENAISSWVSRNGIILEKMAIADVDFSDRYDEAIEQKQAQEQVALQKKYELEKTQTEAQMAQSEAEGRANAQIQQARGIAEALRMQAQAEAEALRIRSEAQAEYNRKVAESLTPMLIQNNYVSKWDGAVPMYQLSNGSETLLMLPTVNK